MVKSVEQFLAEIQPKRNINQCWQEGCQRYIQAHGRFDLPTGEKPYRLCMTHFLEAQKFVLSLERNRLDGEALADIERCPQCHKVKRITGNYQGPLTNGLTYASEWCSCQVIG